MAENLNPNFANGNKQHALYLIARYLDTNLNPEIFLGQNYPENLHGEYRNMTIVEKNLWFECTFNFLLRDSAGALSLIFNRGLSKPEFGLIRRRIVSYLKSLGFIYERD